MNIGQLKHSVKFERSTETTSDYGEPEDTWVELATAPSRVEPLAGKERFDAMRTQADVDYRIVCRYQSALSALAPKDRATWNGITFDIKSVINTDERNVELQVFAKRHI